MDDKAVIEALYQLFLKKIEPKDYIQRRGFHSGDTVKDILDFYDNANDMSSKLKTEALVVLLYQLNLFDDPRLVTRLNQLLIDSNHERHEDIARLLQEAASPSSVPFLFSACFARYEYLAYDEFYNLAVKSIWALGDIGTADAVEKLEILQHSENSIIQKNAIKQLTLIAERKELSQGRIISPP